MVEQVEIPIHGKSGIIARAIIDVDDSTVVLAHRWNLDNYGYPKTGLRGGRKIRMHRLILTGFSQVIDHINGNKLDNRRTNLRACTQAQNLMNSRGRRSSLPRGVDAAKNGKFTARTMNGGRKIHLGTFASVQEAESACRAAESKLRGNFAPVRA